MQMRRMTALVALAICLVASVGWTAGATEEAATADRLVIDVVGRAKPNWGGTEDNKLFEAMEEAANVELRWEIPPTTSYTERLNVIMASGDLPDLMWSDTDQNFWNWVESGLVLAVDDYLADTPNITETVSRDVFNKVRWTEDGKLYGIARPMPVFVTGLFWRKDWLDALGLDVPQTLDEAVDAWRAIANSDFDGNGAPDTYGFSMIPPLGGPLQMLFPALGVVGIDGTGGTWYLADDGEVDHLFLHPRYTEALAFVRDLYREGIIEREFILNKSIQDLEQKMNQGLTGSMFNPPHVAGWTRIKQKTEEVFPEADVVFEPPLSGPGGQGSYVDSSAHWGVWLITTTAKDPKGILGFLDLMHSEEWNFKQNTGIEGVHYQSYNPEQEVVVRSEEQAAQWALDYNPQVWFTRRPDGEVGFYARAVGYERAGFISAFATNTDQDYYYRDVSAGYYPPALRELDMNRPDWRQELDEIQAKIIIGEAQLREFADYVERLVDAGLDKAIAEMQEYFDTMN